jgi:hypothetical protein
MATHLIASPVEVDVAGEAAGIGHPGTGPNAVWAAKSS